MVGILKTQDKIVRAREQAKELKQRLRQLEGSIRKDARQLEAAVERLCGRIVLHLLRQGTPISAESIVTQARAATTPREQDAAKTLIDRLQRIPLHNTTEKQVLLDPRTLFVLGEPLKSTEFCSPVDYRQADISHFNVTISFQAASPEKHRPDFLHLVQEEGPICHEMICSRVRQIWRLAQFNTANKDAIRGELLALKDTGQIGGDAESFWPIDRPITPRKRSKAFRESYSSGLIPAVELKAAIVQRLLVAASNAEEITTSVCEQLGYEAKSHGMKTRIMNEIERMFNSGEIVVKLS